VFDEHYLYLPTDYKSRTHEVDRKYRNLKVKYVDAHDIWFTKLRAFRSKDKVDMVQMIKEGVVDTNALDTLFEKWNSHWFNNNPELVKNYSEVRYYDSENGNT
jgi:alpha-N-acetylglucosamine transferase